jgi:hypothetical protein
MKTYCPLEICTLGARGARWFTYADRRPGIAIAQHLKFDHGGAKRPTPSVETRRRIREFNFGPADRFEKPIATPGVFSPGKGGG